MTKPYIVSVNFNFEGQKNKYLDDMIRTGAFRDSREMEAARSKPYDFKCTFPGVAVDDILVVKCSTGYQVVKAVKVSHPDTIPDHATARIIAKLDLPGIARHEAIAEAQERLEVTIEQHIATAAKERYLRKLAKKDPVLSSLLEAKAELEGTH